MLKCSISSLIFEFSRIHLYQISQVNFKSLYSLLANADPSIFMCICLYIHTSLSSYIMCLIVDDQNTRKASAGYVHT